MDYNKNLNEYKKEAYFCNKCNRFHSYLTKGKPSETHLEHFAYKRMYKSEFTQSELFKLDFKKKWKREGNKPTKLK